MSLPQLGANKFNPLVKPLLLLHILEKSIDSPHQAISGRKRTFILAKALLPKVKGEESGAGHDASTQGLLGYYLANKA